MKKLLLFSYLLFIGSITYAQTYVWTQKANYGGGAIYSPFSFSIGSLGYAGGGKDINGIYHTDFWEYNPSTNLWTQKANYPSSASYACRTFVIQNTGYVATGHSSTSGFLNQLWQYNPATNSWLQKASYPAAGRYTAVAFAINNKGYMGTGSQFGNNYYNDMYEYDPALDSWTQKANFPGALRQAATSFVFNGFGYVGLGSNANGNNYTDFYQYDPNNNIWTSIAGFPGTGRNAAFSFIINNIAHVTQGYNYTGSSSATIFNDHWTYDPVLNSWLQLANFPAVPHFEGAYFSIGVNGYMGMGGVNTSFTSFSNTFWEYAPVLAANNLTKTENTILIYPNPTKNVVNVKLEIAALDGVCKIFDGAGKIVFSKKLNQVNTQLNLSALPNGEYTICVFDKNKKISSQKLLLQ